METAMLTQLEFLGFCFAILTMLLVIMKYEHRLRRWSLRHRSRDRVFVDELPRADNSNRELIFYYADHAHLPAKALEVAQAEYARRHDVFTLDAYAWALHVNGRDTEACTQIAAALAVGVHDAKMLRHAGEIAWGTGDRAAAERYLLDSAKMNAPGSSQARDLLASLSAPKKN
jgi:hypothetical protein